MSAALQAFAAAERPRIEAALERALAGLAPPLGAAAAYSVRAGGKRIRPLLTLACHQALGSETDGDGAVHSVAAAVELVHTYSLLHDDLPAMDDDPLRRGLPTAHRVYGVAVAAAAGAALQELAFLTLARAAAGDPGLAAGLPAMLRRLAAGAGADGMVGGQYLDLEAEGRAVDGAGLEAIHRAKTAALFATACTLGALTAGGDPDQVEALDGYGTYLGLAFQIVDDLLDETGDAGRMGKAVGVDRRLAKATYPSVYGLEAARRLAERVAGEARARLAGLDGDPSLLDLFVDLVLERLD
ncbi:MAG TPA: farnesyl diphosphate synthase [Gemmatimonadota bacterium]|jgi:geranylgeranyl pyrophosphate synthase|nr:farnesyl diphosphate synthase [Gemmatimonadota bacterium]